MAVVIEYRLHKGDIGAVIRLTSDTDLSTNSLIQIKYAKPSGVTGVWTAVLSGTTDIQFTTTAVGDLDETDQWTFQGYAELPGGLKWHSTQVKEDIGPTIADAA